MKTVTKISTALMLGSMVSLAASANGGDRAKERFDALDTNGDGVITHSEMMAHSKSKFDEFDKNRDGFLELAELPKEMPVPERAGKRQEKRMEKMKARAERRGGEFNPEDIEELKVAPTRMRFIAKLDRDGDEKVSLDEFSVRAVKRFKQGDVNGDGTVSFTEAKDAMKQQGKKFRKWRGGSEHR